MSHGRKPARIGRRFFLRRSAAATGMVSLLAGAHWSEGGEPGQLRAGVGIRDITPPLEVGILMSSGRQLWEPFEGVRLPLQARALLVEQRGRRIAVVSLDLLGLAGQAVGGWNRFKQQVVAAARGAVAADDLVITSTHTHSGPESIALSDLFHTQAFQAWVARLGKRIGEAIEHAAASMRPCRLMVGSRAAPGLCVNRRIRTTRGIASVNRQLPPEVVIGPEGPVDDQVRVAAFVDAAGKPFAIVVNFTAHPVMEMCIKQVSPDYPGEMIRELQRRCPGAETIFLQGACGNINPPITKRSAENCRRYGQRLAQLVHATLQKLKPSEGEGIDLRWKTVRLPQRNLKGQPEPQPLETRIGAARIGNTAFVFLPGEPFVEIGLAIREASPWELTMIVGYAEDYIGYIPTDRAFANGGYEIGPGRWSRVGRGSEAMVCREAIGLVKALAGR